MRCDLQNDMKQYVEQLKKLEVPLLRWYDENRRILPWREEVSPYRTWISEIMLQQTRVAAVLPYFERFMARYPTVEALAEGEEGELLKLWEGLGYYSRARNLRKTAKTIVEQYGGAFPQTYKELLALPGIGDYTAGAILSIAFGRPVPAVDGNVLRVASRIAGIERDILDMKNRRAYRELMAQAMSAERPGAYNQALMDLGAGVCLPGGTPLCEACPAAGFCAAKREGRQGDLPVRAPKKEKKVEHKTVFVLINDGEIALRQRPNRGLLAGLWEFPHVDGLLDEENAAKILKSWGLTPHKWVKTMETKHIFTHIVWQMRGYIVEVNGTDNEGFCWCDEEERGQKAVPSAFEAHKNAVQILYKS